MQNWFYRFSIVVLLILSLPASAKDIVQVELIIFRHQLPLDILNENWPSISKTDFSQRAVDLNYYRSNSLQTMLEQASLDPIETNTSATEVNTNGAVFEKLSEKDYLLTKEEQLLANQAGLQPVLHLAWLQDLAKSRNQAIHIYNNRRNNNEREIDGIICLSRQGIIKVRTHFIFNAEPIDSTDTITGVATTADISKLNSLLKQQSFELLQTVNLNEHELRYIDHPVYGILIKVKPRRLKG